MKLLTATSSGYMLNIKIELISSIKWLYYYNRQAKIKMKKKEVGNEDKSIMHVTK